MNLETQRFIYNTQNIIKANQENKKIRQCMSSCRSFIFIFIFIKSN